MFSAPRNRFQVLIVMVMSVTLSWSSRALAADPLLDAKRKAAADLVKQNKPNDALTLLNEVVTADGTNYKDHLAIARIQDKLGHPAEAKTAYRRVTELIPAPRDYDERLAKTEADKRVKAIGVGAAKMDEAIDGFLKKLDLLERDATTAKDEDALDRIFRLRVAIIRAEKPPNIWSGEVYMNSGAGFELPVPVSPGERYHVIAHGRWRYGAGGDTECTAAGDRKKLIGGLPAGQLRASIDGKTLFNVGEEAVINADIAGHLVFYPNVETMAPKDRSGSILILIRKE